MGPFNMDIAEIVRLMQDNKDFRQNLEEVRQMLADLVYIGHNGSPASEDGKRIQAYVSKKAWTIYIKLYDRTP